MRSKQDNEVVKLLLAYAPRTITVKELGYESLIIGCGEVDPLTISVSVRDKLPQLVYVSMWSQPISNGGMVGYVITDATDQHYVGSGILDGELLVWEAVDSEE